MDYTNVDDRDWITIERIILGELTKVGNQAHHGLGNIGGMGMSVKPGNNGGNWPSMGRWANVDKTGLSGGALPKGGGISGGGGGSFVGVSGSAGRGLQFLSSSAGRSIFPASMAIIALLAVASKRRAKAIKPHTESGTVFGLVTRSENGAF